LKHLLTLIKVHQRNNARTSTPSKRKNNKHSESHSTQLARNKTKGKTNNNNNPHHPFPSPSIVENLVMFYFGWLMMLFHQAKISYLHFSPHMVYNNNQAFDVFWRTTVIYRVSTMITEMITGWVGPVSNTRLPLL
jgi:hypothetical protein